MDIHIEHVSKKFKENQLFEDVNLTLSDGIDAYIICAKIRSIADRH